jgi:serine/threonine-protein kinase
MATDVLLGRTVALKLLHPEFARDGAFIERFRREARAAASLSDPRIVSIFDWGSDEGTYYIVMEYVEGKSLKEMIQSEGPFTPQRAVEIAADVCTALHAAHKRGIVHRDVKPANIMVTSGGETKVMDFGIARAPQESGQTVTQTGTVMGTANYISPEQALAMPVDARSDVYSAGVVLYEMLTRDVPFKADTAVAIAYKHVKEDPVAPSDLNPDVTPEVDAVVLKAMAKNPDNRYQSADEMRQDLDRLLRGQPTDATPLLPDRTAVIRPGGETIALRSGDVLPGRPAARSGGGPRAAAITLVVLLFLGIIAAAVALGFSWVGNEEQAVVVPDVVNLTLGDASNKLNQEGLKVKRGEPEFSETIDEDRVVRQEPEDGIKAAPGDDVTLFLSKGPDRVTVPDLHGKTPEQANKILEDANLKLGLTANEFQDATPQGQIARQSPAPNQKAERDTSVDVWVSAGREMRQLVDVTGVGEKQAREALIAAGFNVVPKDACDASKADGLVVAQDPQPGNAPRGSNVTLTINRVQSVPNVRDMTEDEAISALQQRGFQVEVVDQTVLLPTKKGLVIDQNPDPGTAACKGDQVRITVQK